MWDALVADPLLAIFVLTCFLELDFIRRGVREIAKDAQEHRQIVAKHKEQQAIYDEYLKTYYPKLGPKPEAKH